MALLQLVHYNTKINFVGLRFITFAFSTVLIVISLSTYFIKGMNFGIDFLGGYILEVRLPQKPNVADLRDKLSALKMGEVAIQELGEDNDLLIRVERREDEEVETLGKIKKALGSSIEYRRVETVGPKVGSELIQNAIKAVAFALVAMLIYIAIRFEWQFAACAILALVHDCIAIVGLFSVFPLEFNETSIIAILITAGYSISDTIVIFDRIRENLRRYKKMALEELINKSINETLSRTILTASTTLLALLVLYFFGGKVISVFSLPIIIGIIVGSFSSICLAAPLLLYLSIRTKNKEEIQKKHNKKR